jgi:hypothetical protein
LQEHWKLRLQAETSFLATGIFFIERSKESKVHLFRQLSKILVQNLLICHLPVVSNMGSREKWEMATEEEDERALSDNRHKQELTECPSSLE